ncbi:nucleotidyltransferase domain-containing protein [Sphingomonas sp. SUN039]|uniref:nucleotidyltransferase domain-containing protein n=1 Tax=Sphingomonas sp. SUN039 TaxID=2937787 RepID=UPI002164E402|nr:nucleotidyltransferase domain-containing protein [Sphingomonas sp. SUN039]UVO53016.1 nucleotidyltransferase domain-containing protein [Sphingomonas sp. SUN039]
MALRSLAAGLATERVAEIDRRLATIRRDDKVSILIAIESGSRAWGFPSPDSDYDCRFIFVRRPEDYLSPWPLRDVIETPLVDEIDLNGWELGKAIRLLLKGNAVVLEWLMSPIWYEGDASARDALIALGNAHTHRTAIVRHYLHLGERQRRTYFSDETPFPAKKLFYALRPAMALRWLRMHPDAKVPPMHLPDLVAEADVPPDVAAIIVDLVARKAVTRELGNTLLPEPISAIIASEFERAHEAAGRAPLPSTEAKRVGAEVFRRLANEAFR